MIICAVIVSVIALIILIAAAVGAGEDMYGQDEFHD